MRACKKEREKKHVVFTMLILRLLKYHYMKLKWYQKKHIYSDIYWCIYKEYENKTAYLSVRMSHHKNINKLRQQAANNNNKNF